MSERIRIPDSEYTQRIKRASELLAPQGFDVLIANSNEADFANCRYFSGYWPLFEIGGVAIAPSGQAALMIGPESETYARDRSKIPNIHLMTEYRESADPAYPSVKVSSFADVLRSIGISQPKRIGVAGYLVTTMPVYEGLRAAFPKAQIVNANALLTSMRQIKSEAELACLAEGLRVSELVLDIVLGQIKPGMTELQVVGLIQKLLYENGAEYESLPAYVLSARNSTHAISRPTHRVLEKGDMVQLNFGARIDGYSPCVGRPICLGKMTLRQRELVEFGREAHYKTIEWLKPGTIAADVAHNYIELFRNRGYQSNYLYGPCHGLGMIEVEPPWMETISNYPLQANMTFQVDTFLYDRDFGLRWENGARITADGVQMLSKARMDILELN
ncbi:MAG: Xaa-Pro peptidase family protein [Phycisphaeraceae bacterium]